MAKHSHGYKVDLGGNGFTTYVHGHRHVIKGGVVQEFCRGDMCHAHNSITGLTPSSKKSVINTKLRDFGAAGKLKRTSINLYPSSAGQLPGTFLEFNVARDVSGTARYAFDIDMEQVLKQSSYGSFLNNNLDPSVKEAVISLTKIVNIEVTRRRVDVEIDDEVIASSRQTGYKTPISEDVKKIRDRKQLDYKNMGSIKEISMGYGYQVRTFTGTDLSVPLDGIYEYGVKMEVEDGIVGFLNQKLRELSTASTGIKGWLEYSSAPKYLDSSGQRFTKSYRNKVKRDYGSTLTPVENAVATYAEILSCVSAPTKGTKVVNTLYPLVNTCGGNMKGVSLAGELIDDLEARIRDSMGSSVHGNSTSTKKNSNSVKSREKTDFNKLTVEKFFSNQTLDVSYQENIGYDFMNISNSGQAGLKVISSDGVRSRTERELNKFSKKSVVSVSEEVESLVGDPQKSSALSNLTLSQETFLTPEIVYAGEFTINTQGDDISRQNTEQYDEAASQLKSTNLNKNNPLYTDSINSLQELLGSSGISILSESENYSGLSEDDGTFFVDDAGIFEETEGFVSKNMEEEAVTEYDDYSKGTEELTSVLAFGLLPASEEDPALPAERYDLAEPENIISSLSVDEVGNMPLQIKSIVLSSESGPKKDWLGGEDSLNSSKFESLYAFNYNTIAQVEVLSYRDLKSGAKEAVWSPLLSSNLRRAEKNPLRCRLRRYSNSKIGVTIDQTLSAPIYDSFFITAGPKVKLLKNRKSNSKTTVSKKMKGYISSQNEVFRNSGTPAIVRTTNPAPKIKGGFFNRYVPK
tara:strand:- start:6860 stop:9268 length:2409 start_codon:yes stop_codon:yes gene_type:complete